MNNQPELIAGFGLVSALSGVDGLRGVRSAHGFVGADLEFVHGETDRPSSRRHAARRGLPHPGDPGVPVVRSCTARPWVAATSSRWPATTGSPWRRPGSRWACRGQPGVIPGGGGTQRLPRLIGIQPALEVIGAGLQLRADKALARGLVDGVHPDVASMEAAAEAFIAAHPRCQQPWDRPGFSFPDVQPGTPDFRNLGMGAQAMLYKKTAGAFEAPLAALMVITEGAGLRFDRAVELEGRLRRWSSAGRPRTRSGPCSSTSRPTAWGPPGAGRLGRHREVAILGAGMMGAGLALAPRPATPWCSRTSGRRPSTLGCGTSTARSRGSSASARWAVAMRRG